MPPWNVLLRILKSCELCLKAKRPGIGNYGVRSGTCWMGWFREEELKGILGIPAELRVIGVTPLGVPDQQPRPRLRKNLNEIVYVKEWGMSPSHRKIMATWIYPGGHFS